MKHPCARVLTSLIILVTNFYVYLGDPASYSQAKSYGTLVGDIYHGWLDPDSPGWYFIRFCVMCFLTVLGVWGGIRLQQRFLRNYLHLKLFGYDDGQDPPVWQDPETKKVLLSGRDPIEDQDGCFFAVFFVTTMSVVAGGVGWLVEDFWLVGRSIDRSTMFLLSSTIHSFSLIRRPICLFPPSFIPIRSLICSSRH